MAYIVSPVLGMNLADPATVQAFETTVVNNNFLAIEGGFTADRVRLTAAEAAVDALELITTTYDTLRSGTGGVANWNVANISGLDALTAAEIGDTAFMTTPGTGINALVWQAHAGSGSGLDWQPAETVVADTKANLDAFIAAVAAVTDTRFEVGALAQVTGTGEVYRFTSTVGAYVFVSQPVTAFKRTAANVTTSASFTALDFDNTAMSGAAWTESAGVFTCVTPGTYIVHVVVQFAGNITGVRGVRLLGSGALGDRYRQETPVSASLNLAIPVTLVIVCAASDTITVQSQQNSGGNLSEAAEVTFTRVV